MTAVPKPKTNSTCLNKYRTGNKTEQYLTRLTRRGGTGKPHLQGDACRDFIAKSFAVIVPAVFEMMCVFRCERHESIFRTPRFSSEAKSLPTASAAVHIA
jgi:hypothetical protein